MTTFRYDEALVERYPNVIGGMLLARGVTNGPTTPEIAAAYADEQAATLQRLGKTPLSQVPGAGGVARGFSWLRRRSDAISLCGGGATAATDEGGVDPESQHVG